MGEIIMHCRLAKLILAEGRRQKAEGRRQKAEGRRQKAEISNKYEEARSKDLPEW